MSAPSITSPVAVESVADPERGHRRRLFVCYVLAIGLIVALTVNGFSYYILDTSQRPYAPQHAALRPSGAVGLRLGMLGLGMFLVIFLYPLRKRWTWLGQIGSSRHWLDFHIVLGLTAPFVIAFHSSFKFRGFAGMAFWIMAAVSLSGVVGRYLYGQIPRKVSAVEISLKELQETRERLLQEIAKQRLFTARDLEPLFKLPSEDDVARLPIAASLLYMVALDIARPFHVARLRIQLLSVVEVIITCGGLFRTNNVELERTITLAREQAALSKRLLFLNRAQQVFHLWHVVHKPFSYSFAVLALLHIGVVFVLGYF